MKTILHKAESRGQFDYGWLNTKHTFSFARYYDPDRIGFGALRVLNDDIVQPGEGFGRHPHDNMEIISIPIHGKLLHRDSMGHEQILKTGEVQVMSAGSGLFHEEYNGSKNNPVNFLQLWIIPNELNIKPTYAQKYFDSEQALNTWQKLVSPVKDSALTIQQDATISRVFITEGQEIEYHMHSELNGCYLFMIDGAVKLNNNILNPRDGLGVYDTPSFKLKAISDAHLLNIEIPMKTKK
jgi:redox-sensitive bicupin YhaK (pirin superfamily)